MKVLMLNGSPHKNGCVNRALEEIAKQLSAEGIGSEIFWVGNKPVAGCIGCGYCAKNGKCFADDGVNEFVEKARGADGFIVGSPVHYASASGAVTSFLDRVFYSTFANPEIFRLKPAACIVTARRAGTTATFDQLNKYFAMNQMPIVSSRYWNMVHGNTPEEIEQDAEGMQIMRILAKNMAYCLKCFAAGKNAGIDKPESEAFTLTNFIR